MAIQNIGTTLSGIASDTKPTLTANEKGVIFIETDTNKIYQWDTDSWNQVVATVDDDAITLAKMASGTDGQIITYDASGNPTVVGPGTDGQILTSTGAGSPPAFEDAAGGGGGTIELVADGTIAAGAPVYLTSAGKAKEVKGAWDYPRLAPQPANKWISYGPAQALKFHWDDANNKLVTGQHTSNYMFSPFAIEIAASGSGAAHYTGLMNAHNTDHDTSNGYTGKLIGIYNFSCYDPDTDRLIIGATDYSASTYDAKCFVSGLSGNTWTMGSLASISSDNYSHVAMAYDETADKVVAIMRADHDAADGYLIVGTVTGGSTNSISWGTAREFIGSANVSKCQIVYVPTISKCVGVFHDSDDNSNFKSVNIYVSGTTPSWGAVQTIKSNLCDGTGTDNNGIAYDSNANKIVAFFSYNSATSGAGGGGHNFSDWGHKKFTAAVAIGTPGTDTTSWATHDFYTPGADTMGHSAAGARRSPMYFGLDPTYNGTDEAMGWDYQDGWVACCYIPDAQKILAVFVVEDAHIPTRESHGHNTPGSTMYSTLGTISGTNITWTSPEVIHSGGVAGGFTVGYDESHNRAVIGFSPATTDQMGVIPGAWESGVVEDFNVGHLDQYIGLNTAAITSDGDTATITVAGGVNENQSSLVVGSTYYLAPTGEIHNQLARHWQGHQITIGQAISATKILVGSDGYGNNLPGWGKY